MNDDLPAIVAAHLPLAITRVSWNDPFLTIGGEGWALALQCPWTLVGPDLDLAWDTETLEDDAWDLVGHEITGVVADGDLLADPRFEMSGGMVLDVRADTHLDPWVLSLPGIILVGTLAGGH